MERSEFLFNEIFRILLNYLHCKIVCIYVENAVDIYASFVDSLEAYTGLPRSLKTLMLKGRKFWCFRILHT